MGYSVIVCDLFHFADDPAHEIEVPGFLTRDQAVAYARRRLRSSLEDLRRPGQSPEELRGLWSTFGEDCRVVGPEGVVYRASAELDHFLRHPATPEACDYLGLYESLLPEDFALVCEWAAGAVPPPHYYAYRIALRPYPRPTDTDPAQQGLYPRLQGTLTFWPDYPGPDVPSWTHTFPVQTREGLRVYACLQEHHLLDARPIRMEESAHVSLGGETVMLEVTALGRTRHLHSADLPSAQQTLLLGPVMDAVRQAVPGYLWEEVHARRRAYHQGGAEET